MPTLKLTSSARTPLEGILCSNASEPHQHSDWVQALMAELQPWHHGDSKPAHAVFLVLCLTASKSLELMFSFCSFATRCVELQRLRFVKKNAEPAPRVNVGFASVGCRH